MARMLPRAPVAVRGAAPAQHRPRGPAAARTDCTAATARQARGAGGDTGRSIGWASGGLRRTAAPQGATVVPQTGRGAPPPTRRPARGSGGGRRVHPQTMAVAPRRAPTTGRAGPRCAARTSRSGATCAARGCPAAGHMRGALGGTRAAYGGRIEWPCPPRRAAFDADLNRTESPRTEPNATVLYVRDVRISQQRARRQPAAMPSCHATRGAACTCRPRSARSDPRLGRSRWTVRASIGLTMQAYWKYQGQKEKNCTP
jgi:hypothetical protein